MDQELPPELDENTPVVWPTDPEEDTNDEMTTDDDEDKPSTSSNSTSGTYSYWFGGEVGATQSDNPPEDADETETEEPIIKEKQTSQRSRRKKYEEDDPDWTEETDGIIIPKKRLKRKQESGNKNPTSVDTDGGAGGSKNGESKHFSRFRFSWTEDFKWLRYDAWAKQMFCRVCQQAGQVGEFTQGSKHFDKSSLHMHNGSQDHLEAEFLVKRLASNESGKGDDLLAPELTKAGDEEDDVDSQNTLYSEAGMLVALRTAFYAAQNACDKTPTQVYKSMMELQDACDVLGARELRLGKQPVQCIVLKEPSHGEGVEYAFGDDESLAEMHDVLARIVQEDLYSKIVHCDHIGIIIQEYPDADLQPLQMQLVIHARYTNKGHISVGFLATIIVSEDKPGDAVKEVLRVLQECDIPMQKVVAVQIQCPRKNSKLVASSGIHHWQMAKSFADISANMIVLVSAQRHPPWNMCLSLAAQKLEEGTKYQHLLGRLVIYLQSISSKLQAIEALKELVNDPLCQWDGLQMPAWMMVQKTAKVVCSTWSTVIEVLETEADTQKDTQAKQLIDELQKYQFLAFIHLLLDCLPILNDLEKQLNNKSPKAACEDTTESLNNLLEHPGDNERRFSEGVDLEKKTFHNRNIYVSDQQQERSNQMRDDFIQSLCLEIDARCSVLDKAAVLRGPFKILDPKILASKRESELGEFGLQDLQELATTFLDMPSDKDLFPEYQEMKMLLFTHHKNDSLKTVSEKITPGKIQKQVPMTPKGIERCPNMIKLLRCGVTIPGVCRKADQEAGQLLRQSQEFIEKHGTEATTLSRMMIANHGSKISAFDFIAALQEWNSL